MTKFKRAGGSAGSRFLPAVGLALIVAGAIIVDVKAMLHSGNAQTGTTTFAAGGVTGPVGCQGGAGSEGSSCWGVYGHAVTGSSCSASDNKSQSNNLEVCSTWQTGDGVQFTIDATAVMNQKYFVEQTQGVHCLTGTPAWAGVSTTVLNIPAVGTGGGSGVAGTWSVNLGQTPPQGQEQGASMSPVAWTVDPLNPDTQVKIVSSKVACSLNATVVRLHVTSTATAKCTLTVTVTPS